MSAIRPNKDQFVQLMEAPDEGPVVMLNLLKFKERADGAEGSGASAYARYGDAAVQMVEARGGKVLWMGRADQILIGDASQDWDSVALVQYPSRKEFRARRDDPNMRGRGFHAGHTMGLEARASPVRENRERPGIG